jgi:uncharacterized membrane protein
MTGTLHSETTVTDKEQDWLDDAVPSWLPVVASVVSLAGVGVSTYLTLAHYTSVVKLVCSATGAINCEAVTTSPQSVLLGIPVAVLGVVWFVGMLAVNLPAAWRSDSPWRWWAYASPCT